MEFRIIKSPSAGTLEILRRRVSTAGVQLPHCDAVGLIQGRLIEMLWAADIAEKAVGVTAVDVRGSCPQNMILLALFGDTASVEGAIAEIKRKNRKVEEEKRL